MAKDESHFVRSTRVDGVERDLQTPEAAFTCNLPHCDNHVALLLCGLHDIPSVLDLKTRGRASFGHRFGLCSCEGDSSMTATSPVFCDKVRDCCAGVLHGAKSDKWPSVTSTGSWVVL